MSSCCHLVVILLSSCCHLQYSPLKTWVYREGFARFSNTRFSLDSISDNCERRLLSFFDVSPPRSDPTVSFIRILIRDHHQRCSSWRWSWVGWRVMLSWKQNINNVQEWNHHHHHHHYCLLIDVNKIIVVIIIVIIITIIIIILLLLYYKMYTWQTWRSRKRPPTMTLRKDRSGRSTSSGCSSLPSMERTRSVLLLELLSSSSPLSKPSIKPTSWGNPCPLKNWIHKYLLLWKSFIIFIFYYFYYEKFIDLRNQIKSFEMFLSFRQISASAR